jgi:hypothetical protein
MIIHFDRFSLKHSRQPFGVVTGAMTCIFLNLKMVQLKEAGSKTTKFSFQCKTCMPLSLIVCDNSKTYESDKSTHMCWRQWAIEPLDYYYRGHNHQDKDKKMFSPLDWINERILVLNMNKLTNKGWSIINLIKFEIIRHNFSIHFARALK